MGLSIEALPAADQDALSGEREGEILKDKAFTQGGAFLWRRASTRGEVEEANLADIEKQKIAQGAANFHRLGWKRLVIVLVVEAIALGSLSLPGAFAKLGMVAGVICCVGIGIIAMYTSYVVGQVKIKFPEVSHYADAGRLMMGRFGYEFVGAMFVLQLVCTLGSHALTGTIALDNLTNNGACSIVFSVVSAVVLFLLAIPPAFADLAILGYIDFASILIAIVFTMIATGVEAHQDPGGLSAVNWSAWPQEGLSLAEAFIPILDIVFAYSFAMCQFSFMDEMHTPTDFPKSIVALGTFEIVIYTLTGAIIYAFVGQDVSSPALLSAGEIPSKVAFGLALPVIFISGSINTTVVSRYIHGRIFQGSVIRYINTPMGWITWLVLIAVVTVVAWIIAEAIPFFSDLLGVISSLFVSGFTFYLPAAMWFMLIKEGPWYERRNLGLSLTNAACFIIGLVVLGVGTYASVWDIIRQYNEGTVHGSFSCAPVG
ncbi:N amino acid transport system protein [Pleurostoma richardsiae]|uniref:N amino acid transport system protein n=1 Tax=Pleurostoma richardsiae TaxID=41990 RepID=A0AA38RNB5_9PEZI|nr:N amino acid transport system protein [Pleurostoma richardsiae]